MYIHKDDLFGVSRKPLLDKIADLEQEVEYLRQCRSYLSNELNKGNIKKADLQNQNVRLREENRSLHMSLTEWHIKHDLQKKARQEAEDEVLRLRLGPVKRDIPYGK